MYDGVSLRMMEYPYVRWNTLAYDEVFMRALECSSIGWFATCSGK